MIQFSEEQIGVLGKAVVDRYRARLTAALAAELPDVLTPIAEDRRAAQLAEWIEMACRGAERIGVVEPGDVGVVVALLIANNALPAEEGRRMRRWIRPMLERPRTEEDDGATNIALAEYMLKLRAASDPVAARLSRVTGRMRLRLEA